MNSVRNCLAMMLGVVAVGLLLATLGVPGAVVIAVAPVAICLSMVLLMTREDDIESGLRMYRASLDGKRDIR